MELSILIPARNEMLLARTIQDILEHRESDTEVIAVLDGQWANPGIPQHERVNVIYVPEAVGQRAAQNLAARLAKGRWVMKVDAHCSFDQGFDRKMIEAFKETGDDVTMVPVMRNLWAYDWKCYICGKKWYQANKPDQCDVCKTGKKLRLKMVWEGKHNPQSTSYSFGFRDDKDRENDEPHFMYSEPYKHTLLYRNGAIVGYKLSFLTSNLLKQSSSLSQGGSQPSSGTSVISLLTDFATSHHLASGEYHFWCGQHVAPDTMSFSFVNSGGGIGTDLVFGIGNELEMSGITTSPILTEMVENGNVPTSTLGQGGYKPGISDTVGELFLSELSTPTITPLINPANPIPTTGSTINSDTIDELNHILGGEFVYSEKTSSFHNGSVALTPIYDNTITETMSLQGSCFMATRENYWKLKLCDEDFGNWGNQGIEVACKTWLSGGRCLVNHKTWYAHMFRTNSKLHFPWPTSGNDQQRVKKNVKEAIWNMKCPYQKYPVSWLVKKFWPVPGWLESDVEKLKKNRK